MTDRPILFSGPMVRALLAGTKTQTRRTIDFEGIENVIEFVPVATDNKTGRRVFEMKDAQGEFTTRPAGKHFRDYHFQPRYAVGDRLYVREEWAPLDALTHNDPGAQALADRGFYRADNGTVDGEISRWRPGMFLPRWASRLTLIVTDVRVERLQDISEADALAEGVVKIGRFFGVADADWDSASTRSRVDAYTNLWNSLNAGRGFGWDANPWVTATTFEVIKQNIDQIAEAPHG